MYHKEMYKEENDFFVQISEERKNGN